MLPRFTMLRSESIPPWKRTAWKATSPFFVTVSKFALQGLPFRPTRWLDEDYTHVVLTLLNSGVVRERRQEQDVPADRIERRKSKNYQTF